MNINPSCCVGNDWSPVRFIYNRTCNTLYTHCIHSVIKSRQCVGRPVKILLQTSGKSQRCSRASTGNGERRMPFQSDSHYLETQCTPSALHQHQSGVVFSKLPVCACTKPNRKREICKTCWYLLQLYCLKAREQALLACTNKAKGLSINRNIGFVYNKGVVVLRADRQL